MTRSNPRCTPYLDTIKIHELREEDLYHPETVQNYQIKVVDIRYLADCTRPDLTYISSGLVSALHFPTYRNWNEHIATIRYLIGTRQNGIHYNSIKHLPPNTRLLQCYVDACFAGDPKDIKYTTGIAIT